MQGSYFNEFYKKPTLGMYDLQILHGQSVGFHILISFLNPSKDSICQITGGINYQLLGPKYDANSLPLLAV